MRRPPIPAIAAMALCAVCTAPLAAEPLQLVKGTYPCYTSVGASTNYAFIDIHIDGPNTYRDKKGVAGKYHVEEKTNKIVFESGSLSQVNAKLMPGPKIGLNMNGKTFFNTLCGLKKK